MKQLVKKPWNPDLARQVICGELPGAVFTKSGHAVRELNNKSDPVLMYLEVGKGEVWNGLGGNLSGKPTNTLEIFVWEDIPATGVLVPKPFNWVEYGSDYRNYVCTATGRPVSDLKVLQIPQGELLSGHFYVNDTVKGRAIWTMDGKEIHDDTDIDLVLFEWEAEDGGQEETDYLLGSKANADHLQESIAQMQRGESFEHELKSNASNEEIKDAWDAAQTKLNSGEWFTAENIEIATKKAQLCGDHTLNIQETIILLYDITHESVTEHLGCKFDGQLKIRLSNHLIDLLNRTNTIRATLAKMDQTELDRLLNFMETLYAGRSIRQFKDLINAIQFIKDHARVLGGPELEL